MSFPFLFLSNKGGNSWTIDILVHRDNKICERHERGGNSSLAKALSKRIWIS